VWPRAIRISACISKRLFWRVIVEGSASKVLKMVSEVVFLAVLAWPP